MICVDGLIHYLDATKNLTFFRCYEYRFQSSFMLPPPLGGPGEPAYLMYRDELRTYNPSR
jgi:hypothetical protein